MAFRKWTDIDRWPEIDLDDIIAQSDSLSTELNKDAVKDAIQTIKNSLSLLEKKKSTKEDRDRMTKERINILLRQGFRIRLREMAEAPVETAEATAQEAPSA